MEFVRQYSNATSLAASGVSLAGLVDDEVRELIASAGDHIESITGGQIFNPVEVLGLKLEGRGSRILYHPKLWKAAEKPTKVVVDFAAVDNRHAIPDDPYPDPVSVRTQILTSLSGTTTVSTSDYVVSKDRLIERVRVNWPTGPDGVVLVDCVWGWLEPVRTKVATELSAELLSDATQVAVDSSVGFRPGDVLLIGTSLYAIVTAVPDGTTIRFDNVGTLNETYAVDTAVRTWGRTPRAIEKLTNHFVGGFIAEDRDRKDGQQAFDPMRIKKEVTDRYMYELFGAADSAGGWVTGSLRHDMTVRRYSRPAVAMPI